MVALAPVSPDMMLATNRKFIDLLPLSSAHARTSSSILVSPSYALLPNFSPINSNTTYGKFLGNSGTVLEYFVRNESGAGISGLSQPEIEKKINDRIIEELQKYAGGQTIYLGDLPENMRGAVANVFLDLGVKWGNLPGLIQKHNTNLINAGVPQSIINNMWSTIGTIWATNNSLTDFSSVSIAANIQLVGLLGNLLSHL